VVAIGCGRPDLRTDLRPEGPPDVLTVMVQTDEFSAFGGVPDERATFCKVDGGTPDPKVPTIIGQPDQSVVQVCPETPEEVTAGFSHRPDLLEPDAPVTEVTNGNPPGFGGVLVRIVFDELLNPDIETLTDSETGGPCTPDSLTCDGHIATTLPVDVNCDGQGATYDGYYVPNGNIASWPPGPSLVVIPDLGQYGAGSQCTVTIRDNVTDKTGTVVDASQRGPYSWAIADLTVAGTEPADGDTLTNDTPLAIFFTGDITGFDTADLTVEDSGGPVNVDLTITGNVVEILPTAGSWTIDETYTVTILDTADFGDAQSGAAYAGGEFVTTFMAVAP
jgi:hypothetical protein